LTRKRVETSGETVSVRIDAKSPAMVKPVEAKPIWAKSGGLALVCEKCTAQRFVEDFPEFAGDERLELKRWLKDRLKAEGKWGPIRVVMTSCLDVCARGRVTILIDPVASGNAQTCLAFDVFDREAIYERIVAELEPVKEKEPVA
jgi:hypothetical protein